MAPPRQRGPRQRGPPRGRPSRRRARWPTALRVRPSGLRPYHPCSTNIPRIGVVGELLRRATLGAALLGILSSSAAPTASAKQVPSPWTWTDYGPSLRDVSCSSPGACVAVGQRAVALRNTPGADVALAWSGGFLKYPEELDGVSCTDTFCL